MSRKRRSLEMSLEEIRHQLRMHELELREVLLARKHSKGWAEAYRYDAVIKYHRHRIENYRSMIKKEEQQ